MAAVGIGGDMVGVVSNDTFALPILPSPSAVPIWALFDPFVVMGEESEYSNHTRMASSYTSSGHYIRASISFAPPPAVSQVHMYTEDDLWPTPSILGADGDLLLIYTSVVDNHLPASYYPANYFIYKTHPLRPSLRRLPHDLPCWDGQIMDTGIVCRGDDYVVAAFKVTVLQDGSMTPDGQLTMKEVGKILRYSSATEKWETMELSVPHDPEKGLFEFVWQTDEVLSYDGRMCWVDYHRGILSVDAFAGCPELAFVPLPGIEICDQSDDFYNGRHDPKSYRKVGVSKGLVKFVDVDNGDFGTTKTSGFTITTWTLILPELEWHKDGVFQVDDLWRLPQFRESPLPRVAPEYPVLSKQEAHVVQFVLQGPKFSTNGWVVTLDMKEQERSSHVAYKSPTKFPLHEDDDVDFTNIFLGSSYISCELSCLSMTTELRNMRTHVRPSVLMVAIEPSPWESFFRSETHLEHNVSTPSRSRLEKVFQGVALARLEDLRAFQRKLGKPITIIWDPV